MGCASSTPVVEDIPEAIHNQSKTNRGNTSTHSQENGGVHKVKSRQNSVTKVSDDVGERRKEKSGLLVTPEGANTASGAAVGAILASGNLGPPTAAGSTAVPATAASGTGGPSPSPRTGMLPKSLEAEQLAAGWPSWLAASAGEAIRGWVPKRAESFEKLDKVHVFQSQVLHSKLCVWCH